MAQEMALLEVWLDRAEEGGVAQQQPQEEELQWPR